MKADAGKLLDLLEEEVEGIGLEARKKLFPIIDGFINDLKRELGKVMKLKADKRLRNLEISLKQKYNKRSSVVRLSDIPEQLIAEIREICELELASKYRDNEIKSSGKMIARDEPDSETGPMDASLSDEITEELPVLTPIEPVELYIGSLAFRTMMEHCVDLGNQELEALGFLLGDHFTHGGEEYTVVEEVVTSELDSSSISVKIKDFTSMFERMYELEKAGKDYILVGWYHSHPGHTCFLSPSDIETQKRMFRESYHVAVVVDPVNTEIKSFKLKQGDTREISFGVYR